MAQVIAIVNQKGGVGKTTVCRTLANMLSKYGRVLAIDFDPQETLSISLGATKDKFDEESPSMYHVLAGELHIEDAIINLNDFDIVRSDYRLYSYSGTPLITKDIALEFKGQPEKMYNYIMENIAKSENPKTDDRHKLSREISRIDNLYDYILIDVNPNLGPLTILGLMAAPITNILIPAFPEESSRQAVIALADTIETLLANDFSQQINILGILIAKYERNNISGKYLKFFSQLAENMDTILFKTLIPKSVIVSEAIALKQSIFERRKSAPIIDKYNEFCDEFLQRLEYFKNNNCQAE